MGDEELWQLTNATLPENAWPDKDRNILAQDILYVTFDQSPEPNYWVFQCNPDQYDIFTEWQGKTKETWRVSTHKKEIKSGDKVILWVTGKQSGCYGLCTVTSELLKDGDADYVEMSIDKNAINTPVLKASVVDLPEFENFRAGNQGTNLRATKEQFEAIGKLMDLSSEEKQLLKRFKEINDERSVRFHFEMIDLFIDSYQINEDDKRLVFSTPNHKDGLTITVNQRYVFKATQNSFRINLPISLQYKSVNESSYIEHELFKELKGIETPAFYVYFKKNQALIKGFQKDWLEICKENLDYGNQSGYLKYDNPAYRRAVFDIHYREKMFEIAFSNSKFIAEEPSTQLKALTMNPIKLPKNLILYGPPGTGKTYNTINKALEICGISIPKERREAVQKFKGLMDEGQIVFSTFHQSMSYEDFVEGIKPVLVENQDKPDTKEMIYDVEPGILKRICNSANEKEIVQRDTLLKLSSKNKVFKVSLKSDNQSYNVKRECFENNEIRIGWDDTGNLDNIFLEGQKSDYFEKCGKNDKNSIQYFYELKAGDVVLIFHDLKTIDGIGIVEDVPYFFNNSYPEFKHVRKVKWISKNVPIPIFELNKETNLTLPTVYRLNRISIDDIAKLIQEQGIINTEIKIEKNEKNYVLIIDEINRGNISKIFGELITLIEPDKRQGEENELEVTLPYSKTKFSVPPNLYIIGTMNTADRSIALIDTALRRRFDFKEMMPDSSLLSSDVEGINLQLLLDKINERIEFLLDRDHTIGHSYFIKAQTKNDVCVIFKNRVIPLLQEYFYNDWEKIQLVLGDNWRKNEQEKLIQLKKSYTIEEEKRLFGIDVDGYEDEKIFEINAALRNDRFEEITSESFIHIYQKPEKTGQQ